MGVKMAETKYIVIESTLVEGNYSVNVGVNSDAVRAAVLQRIGLGEEYYKEVKDSVEGGLCREASRKFTEGLQQLLWPGGVLDEGRGDIPTSPTSCCYSGGKVNAHFVLSTGTITEAELTDIVKGVVGLEKELYADVTKDLEGGIVREQLAEARSFAKEGAMGDMIAALKVAGGYATKTGQDISAQREGITKICYAAMVPRALEDARKAAEAGLTGNMMVDISSARAYAQEAGIDITKQVEEIEELTKK